MGEAAIAGQQHEFQLPGLKDLTIDNSRHSPARGLLGDLYRPEHESCDPILPRGGRLKLTTSLTTTP